MDRRQLGSGALALGAPAGFAVHANGRNGQDENPALTVVPSPLPILIPPQSGNLTTHQQIVAIGQATRQFDIAWRSLLSGNTRIRPLTAF